MFMMISFLLTSMFSISSSLAGISVPSSSSNRMFCVVSDDQYIKFMEETGAEYAGRMMMWIYFRKKTEDGVFDLYSDIDSKISHLDRIGKVLLAIGGANLIIGVINSWNPSIRLGWINLLCATLLMYALGRIHGKKEALEKERELHE